jgi:xylulokinase
MPIYLGLDCGTQSMNALALEIEGERRKVLFSLSLPFDESFPGYGTEHGVFPGEDPRVVTSSPLMWAEALDEILGRVARALGRDLVRVAAVSGSAQQHGSVYLRPRAAARLAALDPDLPLASQLDGVFSVPRSPVWMDASTAAQCAAITEGVGGAETLAEHTGSVAFERFTGPQIRKLHDTDPAAWTDTGRVHLVSSWLATLLLGAHAPVDRGDGAGMNLLDLRTGKWWGPALEATAPGLADRLPAVVPSDTVVGGLSGYWRARHGFPTARVVAWTGDNPSSLVGLGVVRPECAAVSLGTSDTVFSLLARPAADPAGCAHVFGAPTGGFMSLVCFRNGSLARERVRDRFGMDWSAFSAALRSTAPGNGGAVMLPWFEPEITPPVPAPGLHVEGLADDDAPGWVRACVEGQVLAMKRHSAWAAPTVERIHAAGGAARNTEVLQVIADVFGAPVHRVDLGNAACLGAALRAAHADLATTTAVSWEQVLEGFVDTGARAAVVPDPRTGALYAALARRHAQVEAHALRRTE